MGWRGAREEAAGLIGARARQFLPHRRRPPPAGHHRLLTIHCESRTEARQLLRVPVSEFGRTHLAKQNLQRMRVHFACIGIKARYLGMMEKHLREASVEGSGKRILPYAGVGINFSRLVPDFQCVWRACLEGFLHSDQVDAQRRNQILLFDLPRLDALHQANDAVISV